MLPDKPQPGDLVVWFDDDRYVGIVQPLLGATKYYDVCVRWIAGSTEDSDPDLFTNLQFYDSISVRVIARKNNAAG